MLHRMLPVVLGTLGALGLAWLFMTEQGALVRRQRATPRGVGDPLSRLYPLFGI
jgi:hypothetical protein